MPDNLAAKYNVPVPRYTSYPAVPFWSTGLSIPAWKEVFARQFHQGNVRDGLSIYIHLPFCETLCSYCGCNKKITNNHQVEDPYIDAVLKEWKMYKDLMEEAPVIREIHLGGGTPTFFSPENLRRLIQGILEGAVVHPLHVFSLEGHPNNTSKEHLNLLYGLGFRRVSYGVQDTNPEVQRLINRIQPFENVVKATVAAREAGFTSVNFDLIYGLPGQDINRLLHSVREALSLRPDRVAFYSYAHTPWTGNAQRLIDEKDLPSAPEKLELYLRSREVFLSEGYTDIGMDHYALPTDELFAAWKEGTLHRNFMGYTPQKSSMLVGLGVSSISDTGLAYAQNDKTLAGYYLALEANQLPVKKGYILSEEDRRQRGHILDIACKGRTLFNPDELPLLKKYSFPVLRELEKDGLVHLRETEVSVTNTGRSFIRNICRAFDLHLLIGESAGATGTAEASGATGTAGTGKQSDPARGKSQTFSNAI